MFKPTQCLEARLRLTTKQVNGGYYKGNRTGSMGKWGSRKGTYTIDWTKVRTYVSPDLHGFKVRLPLFGVVRHAGARNLIRVSLHIADTLRDQNHGADERSLHEDNHERRAGGGGAAFDIRQGLFGCVEG
jgi:hypothetical protein